MTPLRPRCDRGVMSGKVRADGMLCTVASSENVTLRDMAAKRGGRVRRQELLGQRREGEGGPVPSCYAYGGGGGAMLRDDESEHINQFRHHCRACLKFWCGNMFHF